MFVSSLSRYCKQHIGTLFFGLNGPERTLVPKESSAVPALRFLLILSEGRKCISKWERVGGPFQGGPTLYQLYIKRIDSDDCPDLSASKVVG